MVSKEEKVIRLLQYLKKYTDKDNPTSMPLIDYYFAQKGEPNFFGPKESRRKTKREMIKELVRVLNTDMYGNPLPREEWRLIYDGYGEESSGKKNYICNLYYVQPFSKWEVKDILDSIGKNPELDEEKKKTLRAKVGRHLSNANYESTDPRIKRGLGPVEKKKYLIEKKRREVLLRIQMQQKMRRGY